MLKRNRIAIAVAAICLAAPAAASAQDDLSGYASVKGSRCTTRPTAAVLRWSCCTAP
jgi:hypothetical protein